MDWNRLDRARRRSGPIELDVIEAYAHESITRRDFVRRGTIIGLTVPVMGAIVAACGESSGSDASTGRDDSNSVGSSGRSIVWANEFGDANAGLDPVNMVSTGTFNVVSQSMEYLVGVTDGAIGATALATRWWPNDDGTEWSFELRKGVTWHDGSEFTSADVAATMDRLVARSAAGLDGILGEGAVDSSDPLVAKFTLLAPNGNFPVHVSMQNAQTLITPTDYSDGTTLDERPAGTGAWMLEGFNSATFTATFVPNPNWWGGKVAVDGLELRGFDDTAEAVAAMERRDVDGIQSFAAMAGEALLDDAEFVRLESPASNHRQLWFNVAQGQFAGEQGRLVRQALAWCWDRDAMIDTLFNGYGVKGNDHPIHESLPFFDPDAVEQRDRDIDRAKALLAQAGVTEVVANIAANDLGEVPALAEMMKQDAAAAGIDLSITIDPTETFYRDTWCPETADDDTALRCENSAEFGIVDFEHRPLPDVFLGWGLGTGGAWNASNYANPEFDAQLASYQAAVEVDAQKSAISAIQQIVWNDVPASYPYFFSYLSGHDASVSGVEVTPLGHCIFSGATKS